MKVTLLKINQGIASPTSPAQTTLFPKRSKARVQKRHIQNINALVQFPGWEGEAARGNLLKA